MHRVWREGVIRQRYMEAGAPKAEAVDKDGLKQVELGEVDKQLREVNLHIQ